MHRSLIIKNVIPFIFLFLLLIGGAILADWFLHAIGYVWIGRYFGIAGTILIAASFIYSLRKYKWIRRGSPKRLLLVHEYLTWIGSLMILIHGGIHFNALLPWYAIAAMVIAVASGLTGKFLLKRSSEAIAFRREVLQKSGMDGESIDRQLFWDALVFDLMKKWRLVHLPITLFFGLLAFLHILTIFIFWSWR